MIGCRQRLIKNGSILDAVLARLPSKYLQTVNLKRYTRDAASAISCVPSPTAESCGFALDADRYTNAVVEESKPASRSKGVGGSRR